MGERCTVRTSRDLEFRNVGEPLFVRHAGAEISVLHVVGCWTDLFHAGAPPSAFARRGDHALLLHETAYALLQDIHALLAQRRMKPPVAIAAIVALEDVDHGLAYTGVLFSHHRVGSLEEVRAARQVQFVQKLRHRIGGPLGINQRTSSPCSPPNLALLETSM